MSLHFKAWAWSSNILTGRSDWLKQSTRMVTIMGLGGQEVMRHRLWLGGFQTDYVRWVLDKIKCFGTNLKQQVPKLWWNIHTLGRYTFIQIEWGLLCEWCGLCSWSMLLGRCQVPEDAITNDRHLPWVVLIIHNIGLHYNNISGLIPGHKYDLLRAR